MATKYWLAVCIFLLAFATNNRAQGQTIQAGPGDGVNARIVGRLTDFQNVPIAAARIGIARWDMTVWQPLTVSSATGAFEMRVRLQPGAYFVIAAFGPYEVTRGSLEIRAPAKPVFEVNLRAPEYGAKSDSPPDKTPRIGLLPVGTSPPPRPRERISDTISLPPADLRKPGDQEFVNVFYVTNRRPVTGQPAHYADGPVGQLNMSYGLCKVSIPPTHQPGRLERPSIWRFERVEDLNTHIVITNRELAPAETAFQSRLRRALQESGSEAFIFVHGYNVEFDDAVRRTAQLFRDLRSDGVPILFSWPAQNAWWRYPAAEDVVDASARQLEEFLTHTLANQTLTAVNIVGHSMGNRILTAALERLSLRQANTRFKNIVLAAPDINIADFAAVSGILRSSAGHTTIYSSSHDVALQASKAFHSYPRLGEAPPVRLVSGIDMIDASAIRQDVLGHSYFGDSATVIRDLFLLIRQGLDPQARNLRPMSVGTLRYWMVPRE